jgi:HD superfamily phosphohydrolase
MGVAHLCSELIINLRIKGIDITDEEYEATCAAALLHDIGHGPFSHALEKRILPVSHEEITLKMMHLLNDEFGGRLTLAVEIFKNKYNRPFLHQMLSSQLDVDRMDYLSRDSYYSGVVEGVIGYDRIVKMMNVHHGQLVIEAKGRYSVDKFFMSRHLMYRQVYLHKTAISAESMLVSFFSAYQEKLRNLNEHTSLLDRLIMEGESISDDSIEEFASLDDNDILTLLKVHVKDENFICRYMASGILNRRLLRTVFNEQSIPGDFIESLRHKSENLLKISPTEASKTVIVGMDSHKVYDNTVPIMILNKGGDIEKYIPMIEISSTRTYAQTNYVSYPKEIKI